MNTLKLVTVYATLVLSINVAYSQQQNAGAVTLQCSGSNNDRYSTQGMPGKRGPKGEKGESSTFADNKRKNRRINNKLASLQNQLTSLQEENQRLKEDLNETKQMLKQKEEQSPNVLLNNKITDVKNRLQELLSNTDNRLKWCGTLRAPSTIENNQFTASSFRDNSTNYAPYCGRLKSANYNCRLGWRPETTQGEWIQVDMKQDQILYGVATETGSDRYGRWVTSYTVSYMTHMNQTFLDIKDESGAILIFQGNTDSHTIVINDFPRGITARYIRIHPLTYHELPLLRFDLFTC